MDAKCRAIDETDKPRSRPASGARLIEADVAGSAYAHKLDVDSAGIGDRLLIAGAVRGHLAFGNVGRWYVNVLRGNVDVGEEPFVHPCVVRLNRIGVDGPILVEVEGYHRRKVQPVVSVQADQLLVDPDRRMPGRQAQHCGCALGKTPADKRCNTAGYDNARLPAVAENSRGNSFQTLTIVHWGNSVLNGL